MGWLAYCRYPPLHSLLLTGHLLEYVQKGEKRGRGGNSAPRGSASLSIGKPLTTVLKNHEMIIVSVYLMLGPPSFTRLYLIFHIQYMVN